MAVSAVNSLRNDKRVSLIYNWGNPTTEAVAPITERYRLPLVAMTLDPAVGLNRHFVVRATNSAGAFASISADYLKKKGFTNIGVVIADNTYVQGLFDGLEKYLAKGSKIEVIDRYNIQDQDFRSSITKARSRKYDCLGVFLITGQVSSFYRQLADQGLATPTFGTDFFESTTEIRLARGGMNGSVYPHLGTTPEFRTDYMARFNNDYQLSYAGNAYDMAMSWGRLFNNLPATISAVEVMEKLKSVQNQLGVGGIYSFMDSPVDGPHYHFPVQLKRIQGESIKIVGGGD